MIFHNPHPTRPAFLKRWLHRLVWIGGGVLLLAVFIGVKAKNFIAASGGGEAAETRAKISTLELLLASRKLLDGHYPSQEDGLEKLLPPVPNGRDGEPALRRLKDGWLRRIRYQIPGTHHPDSYDLWSLGPDGIEGTEDDIKNW